MSIPSASPLSPGGLPVNPAVPQTHPRPGSLVARWQQISQRGQQTIRLTGLLLAALLLWFLVIAPSLAVWRTAQAESVRLGAQMQQMQQMQARAQALQKQPPLGYDEALRLLTSTTRQALGGAAQISSASDRVSVTLIAAPADAVAQWLVQIRQSARTVPLEARLQRVSAVDGSAAWSGVLVMAMPAR